MGRRISESEAVVDHIIGPGPLALHGRYRFTPDLAWQHQQIAERHHATGGRSTYLGDWHSHPAAHNGALSWLDTQARQKIIQAPEAQCERPLMAIFWGTPKAWTLTVWQARLRPRRLLGPKVELQKCQVA